MLLMLAASRRGIALQPAALPALPQPNNTLPPTSALPLPAANGRTVLYITERAVFRLVHPHHHHHQQQQQQPDSSDRGGVTNSSGTTTSGGVALELLEVAPGVEVERDILPHMGFAPLIPRGVVRQMPAEIFQA